MAAADDPGSLMLREDRTIPVTGWPSAMSYRSFGDTGLSMPVLSAGFMRAMHGWQDRPLAEIPLASLAKMEGVLKRALACGITHIETARGYGSSERELGVALANIQRGRFILQTKIQPLADPEAFVSDFHDSLARLRVGYVDLLALHGINDHRSLWYACRRGGCLAAARRLQEKGLVRHIGFSGHGDTEVIEAAIRHDEDGGFDYANIHWYFIFQRHWPAIALAHERGLGVFIISPTDKGGMLQRPPPALVELSRPWSPMLFNDLFCLSHPEIATISVGASRPEDFDEHMKAVALLSDPATAARLREIRGRWEEAMRAATGQPRPDLHWDHLPGWERTPGSINMPFILWLDKIARGWQLEGYARWRYGMMGRDGPWVPGNDASALERYRGDIEKILRQKTTLEPESVLAALAAAADRLGRTVAETAGAVSAS